MSAPERSYRWLDQPIARGTMTMGYRLGLACVAVMMVLLPLAYVALCLAAAYGILYYAWYGTDLLGLHQLGFVLYLGPIIAGCIGLVFMVKPLFTSQKTVDASLILTREKEPDLFRFIDEVCERVGAPKPVKVRVDNQVNASASFEHGWWGVLTNRLVLTIGMPLAQGLTVSQFGGVLAHEFGHFTQAVAMRFNYLIRTTNGWFGRVVFERDSWDHALTGWTKGGHIYWMFMAWIANAFVWLARKILEGLMRAGHFFSANMMRQMEYDADHYEKEITGLKNFRETFLRMHLIGAGAQMATHHLNDLWKGGRLVNNLPALAGEMVRGIPAPEVQKAADSLAADKREAQWHSTHPSDYQRISRTTLSSEDGILIGDAPADLLFADFDATAQAITLVDYKKRYELHFKPEAIVPTGAYLKEINERNAKVKSMNAFFGGLLAEHRLIFPIKPGNLVAVYLDELQAEYDTRSRYFEAKKECASALYDKIEEARSKRARILAADALSNVGVRVKPADFGLSDLKAATIEVEVVKYAAQIAGGRAALAPILQLAREKLYLGCLLARSNWAAESPEKVERIEELEAFLVAIQPISQILNEHRKGLFLASIYLENFQAAKNKPRAEQLFEGEVRGFQDALTRIEERGKYIHYPLLDGKKPAHLWGYLMTGSVHQGSVGRFVLLRSIYERVNFLYIEVMLELMGAMAERGGLLTPEEKLIEA